jgi:hypothetical protein
MKKEKRIAQFGESASLHHMLSLNMYQSDSHPGKTNSHAELPTSKKGKKASLPIM